MVKKSIISVGLLLALNVSAVGGAERDFMRLVGPQSVSLGGWLGEAVSESFNGRLSSFITGSQSESVQLYAPENLSSNPRSWRGEHVGKWLYAASQALMRTDDKALRERLTDVADYMVSLQEANGYLGCYRPEIRYYVVPAAGVMNIGWDTWNNSYMMKGLTACYMATSETEYLTAACRIADLMYDTFVTEKLSMAKTGHHSGMVGTGIIEPLAELYAVKPEQRYMELMMTCVDEMDSAPGLGLISKSAYAMDVALIGNGKIYEMLRNFTGLAKLYRLNGDKKLRECCSNAWNNISNYHLNPCGGPWGGVNVDKEVFNRDCSFSPYGANETCSSMEWLHFTMQMLAITGDGRYAEEIEKTIYNAISGARNRNGHEWVYYTNLNGAVFRGNMWSCCWSSGMIAMEDIAKTVFGVSENTVYVNLYTPCSAFVRVAGRELVEITQQTGYPFDGMVNIKIGTGSKHRFALGLRLPQWAATPEAKVNGRPVAARIRNGYLIIHRKWSAGDVVSVDFPMTLRLITVESEYEDDDKFVARYIGSVRRYAAVACGPLIYAADYVDCMDNRRPIEVNADVLNEISLTADSNGIPSFTLMTPEGGVDFFPFGIYASTTTSDYRTVWLKMTDN